MSRWKKFRYWLEATLCRLFAWWIPQVDRLSCVHFANALGTIAFWLDRHGREVALANVECALGPGLTPEQRREIVRASYRNFARAMLDLFWAPALARPENRHWVRSPDCEELKERLRREKRGAVLLTLHYGNWEWGSLAMAMVGFPSVGVAEQFKNPALESIFKSLREVTGQTIIPQEKSILRMLREVKRGGTVCFLADLTVAPDQASAVIRTFALEMCVSVLHGALALKSGALVVPGMCIPQNDGGVFWQTFPPLDIPPDATPGDVAQLCWDVFEPIIRANPGLWLWPYKHFRYRPQAPIVEYPFYAKEWDAFDRLREKTSPPGTGN
jgi:lauroyl/myristoyl acyltransferase